MQTLGPKRAKNNRPGVFLRLAFDRIKGEPDGGSISREANHSNGAKAAQREEKTCNVPRGVKGQKVEGIRRIGPRRV